MATILARGLKVLIPDEALLEILRRSLREEGDEVQEWAQDLLYLLEGAQEGEGEVR